MSKKMNPVEPDGYRISQWEDEVITINKTEQIRRITFRHFLDDIGGIINLQKGLFFTFKELLLRPGKVVREYLHLYRKKYVHPLRYLVLATFLMALLFRIEIMIYPEEFNTSPADDDYLENHFKDYIQFYLLAFSLFYGVFSYFFFKKSGLNLTENITCMFFFTAQAYAIMFITEIPVLFFNLYEYDILEIISLAAWPIYFYWALKDTFKRSVFQTILRQIAISVLSLMVSLPIYFLIFMAVYNIFGKTS